MINLCSKKLFVAFTILLISNTVFSNTFKDNYIKKDSKVDLNTYKIAKCNVSVENNFSITKHTLVAPIITSQPQAEIKCIGENVTFSITASGTGNLSYTWKKDGVALSNIPGRISGATTASLTLTNIISGDAAIYTCEVTDDADPSNPTTSNSAQLNVNPLPTLIKTGNTNVCIGQSTTLSISGASTYVWNNGGNTSNSISVNPTTNTTYTVTGTDGNGCSNTESFAIQVSL